MKVLIISMWICFCIYACQKDDPIGYGKDNGCNCGIVIDEGIISQTQCYWLKLKNECTNNEKTFCLDSFVWQSYSVGDKVCINDISSW